jgi:hypothetical protein
LIGVGPGKPLIVPTGVVGVTTVGMDGRVVRSANATIPFLATLTGQGVESGPIRPSITRFNTPWPMPHWFVAVTVIVNAPGLVGMPEMVPVLGSIDKPWGRKFALKVCGILPFVLNVTGVNGTPVPPDALV